MLCIFYYNNKSSKLNPETYKKNYWAGKKAHLDFSVTSYWKT